MALVGIEDLGTAALMAGVGGLILFVAGCRPTWVLLTGLIGAGGLAALIVAEDYRVERLTAFMDIWADPRGSGYHPIQSLVAIGSGGWWGVGLGSGLQKYGYLPEARTDFIFSVICEETGFMGGALVIGLFIVLVWTGTRAMRMAVTRAERLLAFGITATIGLQAVMHGAVAAGGAPAVHTRAPRRHMVRNSSGASARPMRTVGAAQNMLMFSLSISSNIDVGLTSRKQIWAAPTAVTIHTKVHPLAWNIGSVQR